ncbi:hypothetical protein K2173_027217 [Erythroxylum novogranatense]|uniref:DNA polymerase n=1 Tax=Erythroxylum novogranatense TaxID=1862640 RepID=A0AAV8U0Z4_9ROSI|nr:hypothetical protein K2173_027217 [Erythroxylum novogranatense]
MADSKVFSVRIVSIDYWMAPPIPGLDVCYSSVQGGKVNEVPVIRIYGSTPAGQKTCLHVHRAFPYLYVPCSDIPLNSNQEGDAYTNSLAFSLEKALKLKGSAGLKRQHVHGCSLVRARKFYGYHPSEELFVKIYLYYPQDVLRAANLLLSGAVLERSVQPHESHIPFILQFMVDYNLSGMGHVHLSKIKFRNPVPSNFTPRTFTSSDPYGQDLDKPQPFSSDIQADLGGFEGLGLPSWTSSTIPSDWMWRSSGEFDETFLFQRQSVCELEGDAIVDEILNQQFKVYTSLSGGHSDVKMVQSLVPIWEEEYERTGIHGSVMLPDPSKPHPLDVLKTLSHDLEFDRKIKHWCNKLVDNEFSTPNNLEALVSMTTPNNLEALVSITTSSNKENVVKCENLIYKGDGVESANCSVQDAVGSAYLEIKDEHNMPLSQGEMSSCDRVGNRDPEVADTEALGLLKWLVTYQTAEEMHSDDELVCETILSPLLPATSLDKVLEKANMDYESESQRECQDILDSVEDIVDFERFQKKTSDSSDFSHCSPTSSDKQTTQVALKHLSPSSVIEMKDDYQSCTPERAWKNPGTRFTKKNKGKESLWGSLPFNTTKEVNDELETEMPHITDIEVCENKCCVDTRVKNVERKLSDALMTHPKMDIFESNSLGGCSLRDLMRIKRCRRVVEEDYGHLSVSKVNFGGGGDEDNGLLLKQLDIGCVIQSQVSCSSKERADSDLHIADNSPSPDTIGLSLKNHPVADCKGAACENASSSPAVSSYPSLVNEHNKDDMSVKGSTLDHLLPFFGEYSLGENAIEKHFWNDESKTLQEASIGVPTHVQNDGSVLYLLTPVFSPPSADCVYRSFLQDASREPKEALVKPALMKGPSEIGLHNSSPIVGNKASTESGSASHLMPTLDEIQQGNDDHDVGFDHSGDRTEKMLQNEGNVVPRNVCAHELVDMSHISGPDQRSRPTPLSQIGFRDPASVGAGQQLTLLSVEVHANSRGDLRPDPCFDSINILALAFQHDNDVTFEHYILLYSNTGADHRSFDGISAKKILFFSEEKELFDHFITVVGSLDPDIIVGWDIQGGSLGFLAERAGHLGIGLLNDISRIPMKSNRGPTKEKTSNMDTILQENLVADPAFSEDAIVEDEWGRTHASGIHVGGRIILNVWRLMRGEVKLNMYTVEAVGEAVLRRKIPSIPCKVLTNWFCSGPGRARYKCIGYVIERANLNLEIMNQLDTINRTSELARIFGIDFFSVISRGSQYRVESMLLRLAHTQNYLAISPGYQQVASQPAMECLPLVMEPESGFYADPVVVLDFQSLYPSMIIAYNLCFCTCLANISPSKVNALGVSSFSPDPNVVRSLKDKMLITPNGVLYVPAEIRQGILPRLLEEILSTRVMVKQAMKKLAPAQQILHRIFNARQLALKLIANVTYGYTAAGFSGRMPCAELADSIVQCGRSTLENAISLVNANDKWKARVVYGDTDSMFVLLRGRSIKESFKIGQEIASAVTAMNPNPVTLKLEKVYHPCFLLTKKRYVGYSYESADQVKPIFDAKGIETVRRDSCDAVAKIMEQSLRLFFEHKDISEVREYLQRQWARILSGRVSVQDFVFAKEVRLGTYSTRSSSSLPPAAIVATKAMRVDPRAEPRYAERVPYVVINAEPGARLVDMVVDPLDLLAVDSPYRLNNLYYINKQIIPALQRVFGLVRADLNQWFSQVPRPSREAFAKRPLSVQNPQKTRIDYYYLSKHCFLCGELVRASTHICDQCAGKETAIAAALIGRTSKLEREMQHLAAICRHCGGGDWLVEGGVKCTSLACSVFYERRKVQKALQGLSSVATDKGLYPKCMVDPSRTQPPRKPLLLRAEMASLFLSGLYTPFSAPIHKKGAVGIIPRKATNGTASHLAICNRNRCQFLLIRSSCWYSTACFCSEFFSSCMNISTHNHSINGYWVGPDIDDGWGYVEAFVNHAARL